VLIGLTLVASGLLMREPVTTTASTSALAELSWAWAAPPQDSAVSTAVEAIASNADRP
jgi:hypothetical protein